MCREFIASGFFLLFLPGSPAFAHEVHHTIEATGAVVLRLTYADGKPFTFEAFEAYPDGKDFPAQVGRTDDQGRAVFVPGSIRHWRVKAFSADGHGIDLHFDAPGVTMSNTGPSSGSGDGPNRASLLLFGLSALLSGFGIYQLWLRKNK
jgi:nickel transport protein